VSVGTVSNFLNQPDKVAPATREAVAHAIEMLDFVPNAQARALVQGWSRTVGVIITDLANSFFVEMVRGAEEAASGAGYTLLIASSERSEVKQNKLLRVFDEARLAGVLLAPFEAMSEYRDPECLRLPSVVLNVARPPQLGSSVVSDDELGGYIAAKHMIDAGRHSLLFVGGPTRLAPIRQRLLGVQRAVAESTRVRLTTSHVPFEDQNAEGAAIADDILRLECDQRPDAVISTSDVVASAIIEGVHGILEVPRDLAVIGYDNNAAARDSLTSVTTVAQAGREMGLAAFNILRDELAGSAEAYQSISLPPRLILRGSS